MLARVWHRAQPFYVSLSLYSTFGFMPFEWGERAEYDAGAGVISIERDSQLLSSSGVDGAHKIMRMALADRPSPREYAQTNLSDNHMGNGLNRPHYRAPAR